MSKRIHTFIIGIESNKKGKPCFKCGEIFNEGDEITTRGISSKIKNGNIKNYHSKCWSKLFHV